MKKIILGLIKIYQATISPDHGCLPFLRVMGQCRHCPTCSQYAYQSIKEYGILKGGWRGLKRIFTCI